MKAKIIRGEDDELGIVIEPESMLEDLAMKSWVSQNPEIKGNLLILSFCDTCKNGEEKSALPCKSCGREK